MAEETQKEENANETKTIQISLAAYEALAQIAADTGGLSLKQILGETIFWMKSQFDYKRRAIFGGLPVESGKYRAHIFLEQLEKGIIRLPPENPTDPSSLSPTVVPSSDRLKEIFRKKQEKNSVSPAVSPAKPVRLKRRASAG